jgi:predicted unusual protein kinase regulating ubiquinone biosynthesis (AarF/ABC1/UbiB family)
MKQYRQAFEGFDDIITPNCHEYITEVFPCFIVMERIVGRKVQELHIDELPAYCITFNNILVESLLSRNIVHADLHIGNIFFMENNKIGIIDFGHILYITDELSKKICKFYKFLFNRQTKKLAKFIVNEAIVYNQCNCSEEEFEILLNSRKQTVIDTLAKSFDEDNILCGSSPVNIYNILDINNMLQDINASMREDFMSIVLSFGPFSSVVSILKRNDINNSLKYVFQSYVQKQIPSDLTNYI